MGTYGEVGVRSGTDEAQRLWEEARAIPHPYNPDWENDREYLLKILNVARLGHLEAMAKLGEYAFRRRRIVEAYYWTALAELKGAEGLESRLREIKVHWMRKRCPAELDNIHAEFTDEQGAFARALLRIRCAVNAPHGRARMRELSSLGLPEARLFLGVN